MNIDERIEKLLESQGKTQVMLADIVDSLHRLERVVVTNSLDIEDLNQRLTELETRRKSRPQ